MTVSMKTRLLWFKIPFLLQRQKNIEEKKKQRGCVCHRFVSQYQKHKEAYQGVFGPAACALVTERLHPPPLAEHGVNPVITTKRVSNHYEMEAPKRARIGHFCRRFV